MDNNKYKDNMYLEAANIILDQLKKAYNNRLLLISKILSLKNVSNKLKSILIKLAIKDD